MTDGSFFVVFTMGEPVEDRESLIASRQKAVGAP
jgi:hypothetical protein